MFKDAIDGNTGPQKTPFILPAGLLELGAMYLLWPLQTTARNNNHVAVISKRYWNLSRVVFIDKLQAPQCTDSFMKT